VPERIIWLASPIPHHPRHNNLHHLLHLRPARGHNQQHNIFHHKELHLSCRRTHRNRHLDPLLGLTGHRHRPRRTSGPSIATSHLRLNVPLLPGSPNHCRYPAALPTMAFVSNEPSSPPNHPNPQHRRRIPVLVLDRNLLLTEWFLSLPHLRSTHNVPADRAFRAQRHDHVGSRGRIESGVCVV
jgi:hypothetical protein